MASVKKLKDQLDELYRSRLKLERKLIKTQSSINTEDRFGDVSSVIEVNRIKNDIRENLATEQALRKELFGSWAPKTEVEIVHRKEE